MLIMLLLILTNFLNAQLPKYSSDYVLNNVYNSTSRVLNVAGVVEVSTLTISNVNVVNDTISVRQIEPIKTEQYGDWIIKKATVVIENQIDQPLEDGGNVNITNFPSDYPLPSSQVNDLKVVIDTTTHSELNTLNNKDFATETTLNSINIKVIKCNTDNIAGTVYATPNGTYTVTQAGLWRIDKGTVTISNLPLTYPLPNDQISNLKIVIDTTTHSKLDTLNGKDFATEATLATIDGKITICNTDNVKASSDSFKTTVYQADKSRSISNFPSEYPLPSSQVSDLKNVNIINSTIVVRQADTVNVAGTVNAVQSGFWTVDTTGSTNTVIANNLDIRDLSYTADSITTYQGGTWNVNAIQSGTWSIEKATVVVESGNININNLPLTYPLPSSQITDLKVVVDTTTHNELNTLNNKVITCNTNNIAGNVSITSSSDTAKVTVYQIDKSRSVTNFPTEYPLPTSQINDLKNVNITNSTITVKQEGTVTVTSTDLDIRDLNNTQDSITVYQGGDWFIKKATVVIENQIAQPLQDGGNVNVSNFPTTYALPSSQVNDLKIVIDTTTHNKLDTLNGKDFATETTLGIINGKVIVCNTDNVKASSDSFKATVYQAEKDRTISNLPSEYPLPSSQISDLKEVNANITNSTLTVKQVEPVEVQSTAFTKFEPYKVYASSYSTTQLTFSYSGYRRLEITFFSSYNVWISSFNGTPDEIRNGNSYPLFPDVPNILKNQSALWCVMDAGAPATTIYVREEK